MTPKASLLFVDDEPEFLKSIFRYYRGDDEFDVDVALSPKDAFPMLERRAYDAVISDWTMPGMDGGTFLSIVSDRYPDISRSLMTGVADVDNIAFAVNRSGVERIFLKPIDMSEMRQSLQAVVTNDRNRNLPLGTTLAFPGQQPPDGDGASDATDGDARPKISIKGFVRGLLTVAQSIDPQVVRHSHRVAIHAARLYDLYSNRPNHFERTSGAIRSGRNTVTYAALLHDMGKLFVDRRILEKDTPLYESQVQLLRERLSILQRYMRMRGVQNGSVDETIERTCSEMERKPNDPQTWHAVGSAVVQLSRLTRSIREEIDLKLIDTEIAEALFGSAVGTLTGAERNAIENHAIYSERLVAGIPWPANLAQVPELCRHHHERLDGSGYPDGLTDDGRFSPELRVLAVADVYDAMTDPERTYRPPLSHELAVEHLQNEADDGRLDRDVVETVIRLGKN
jgi:response regulator RpfG family c-di-GMP phosphodiesterase